MFELRDRDVVPEYYVYRGYRGCLEDFPDYRTCSTVVAHLCLHLPDILEIS